jgi:Flp pilus assembly protein TadG
MFIKKSEKGQALILIVLAAIGLFAFSALAIDGSVAFSDRRHAQNAADSAALAGALAYVRENNIHDVAQARTTDNGYDGGIKSDVTVTTTPVAAGSNKCPDNTSGMEVTVTIVSYVDTTFARVIGRNSLVNTVSATSLGCDFHQAALFDGSAIVGLKPDTTGGCAIDTGNSNAKSWTTRGGGVFSNGCLEHPNGTLNVPNDKCITTVGNANTSGGGTHTCVHENLGAAASYAFPADIAEMMPPDPCTGTITNGRYAAGGKVPANGQTTFDNDIFCISDFSTLNAHILLNNATLYVTDESFSTRFNGGGNTGFFGTATSSGVYQGYYMIIKLLSKAAADRCDQYFDFRGNGNLQMVGTILAPSTCVDYRGNSTGYSTHSQIILYQFTGNGNSTIDVTYQADENHKKPVNPSITLSK